MKKLLNTLYVTSENSYLGLDGENIVIYEDDKELGRLPLHNLESIVSFGYRGVSPALMGACSDRNIALCFLTPQGKFLAKQKEILFCGNSNTIAAWIRKSVLKLRKIVFWEKYTMQDGYWNERCETTECRLMRSGSKRRL